jgi:hypothetical protein
MNLKKQLSNLVTLAAIAVIALLACMPARAWGPTGHDVIVQIAYDNLTPRAKAKFDAIVRSDPRGRDLFAMANWPDVIRRSTLIPEADQHPRRHFVNIPFQNGVILPASQRAPLYGDSECVTYAIDIYYHKLATSQTPQDQADALSWLIHVVGDVHQPLHCITLISPEFPAPEGDAGGNKYFIRTPHETEAGRVGFRKSKLHAYWAQAPDRIIPGGRISDIVKLEETTFPKSATREWKNGSPSDGIRWADESCDLAAQVYSAPEDEDVSPQYDSFVITTTEHRLAQAGYRLAGLLNTLWK